MNSALRTLTLATAISCLAPALVFAAANGKPARSREGRSPQQMFDRFDKDGDGRISKAEAPERMQKRWDKFDTNGDGFVDADEHAALVERHRRRSGEKGARSGKGRNQNRGERRRERDGFESAVGTDGERRKRGKRGGCKARSGSAVLGALDTDVNGILSEEEIAEAGVLLWSLDENGDGELSPRELQPRRAGKPAGADGQGRPRKRIAELFDRLDPDGETPISKDALPERMQKRFERMDTDGDGFLDQDEQAAVLDRISQHRDRKRGPRSRRSNDGDDPVPFPDL